MPISMVRSHFQLKCLLIESTRLLKCSRASMPIQLKGAILKAMLAGGKHAKTERGDDQDQSTTCPSTPGSDASMSQSERDEDFVPRLMTGIHAGIEISDDTAEVAKFSAEVDTALSENGTTLFASKGKAGTTANAPMSEEEKLFLDAMSDGTFDLRGKIGKMWTAEKKRVKGLSDEYENVGKSYDAQRKFRQAWVAKKYECLRAERIKRDTVEQSDYVGGKYRSFQQVVKDEGDGTAGLKAAAKYFMNAYKVHQTGAQVK